MSDDLVLWWALILIVVVAATTYRPYLLSIFWNPTTPPNNSLFNQNPIAYTAGQFAGGLIP